MMSPFALLSRIFLSRRAFGLVLLTAFIFIRILDPSPLEELRLRTFDLFQTIKPRVDNDRPVLIVDIDEASLNAYGQWPWPRTLVARLLDRLFESKVKAVAFDVVFSEADRTSPQEAMRFFVDLDDAMRVRLQNMPSNDDILAKAIADRKIVLGQSGARTIGTDSSERPPQTGIAIIGPDPGAFLYSFPKMLRNLPQFDRVAAGRGLFTIVTERDGIVRRIPLVMSADGRVVPALAVDLLRVATGGGAVLVRADQAGVQQVSVAGLQLPTDQNGRVWIHFSPHTSARYISAKDVLEGVVSSERLASKLVLIGTSAIGLLDIKTTPVHAAMPGVEIHAQLVEAALSGSLLTAPSYAIAVEITVAALIGTMLTLLAPVAGAVALSLLALIGLAALSAGSWALYSSQQILIDPSFPAIAVLAAYIGLMSIGYFREQADRRQIRSAFSQYLSPNLVEQLANSPEKLVLGGEERDITVLFSDVRGFTAIAESFGDNPQGLTSLMNRFLTPLTNKILENQGTIDKYMGDAIMAFWNAPFDDARHESHACNAALEMLDQVDFLNRELEREASESGTSFIPLRVGIGINTGRCVVGNMGSDLRFQYTVMGDSVNLASRLEGQTALHGVSLLIGSKTMQAVVDEFAMLQVDSIIVKGKRDVETIFTIVGRRDVAETREFVTLKELWQSMWACYCKQNWPGASELLDRCRPLMRSFGIEELANVYTQRIFEFRLNPPPADWNGVFVAQTK